MQADAYLDDGVRGWIHNAARKHFWRVADWYDLDDLVQDGYVCYYKCHQRYVVEQQPWRSRDPSKYRPLPRENPTSEDRRRLMSRVKMAFLNHVSTLAKQRRDLPETAASQLAVEGEAVDGVLDRLGSAVSEEASAALLLRQLPSELVQLAQALAQDGADVLTTLRHRMRRHSQRETTNEYYCRLLGLDPSVDIRAMLRQHFAD